MKHNAKRLIATAILLLFSLTMTPALSGAEVVDTFSAGARYAEGLELFQSGDSQGAAAAFEEILQREGEYRDGLLYLQYIQAQDALDQNDLAAALSGFEALLEAGFLDAAEKVEQIKALTESPPEEGAPFQNARVTIVNPTRIEVEWDAPDQLRALVEVWCQGHKMKSKTFSGGKAAINVPPETNITVTVSADGHSESIECEIPATRSYKEYGYKREESYTAYVMDAKQPFYKQARKSVRSVTRDELVGNLENGYAYGTHVSLSWRRTQEDKELLDLIVVTRAPNGKIYIEASSPMTLSGNWTGAYVVIQINKSLLHFLSEPDFEYGRYEFYIYSQGLEFGHSALTINP